MPENNFHKFVKIYTPLPLIIFQYSSIYTLSDMRALIYKKAFTFLNFLTALNQNPVDSVGKINEITKKGYRAWQK
jgi:hypothetical protein